MLSHIVEYECQYTDQLYKKRKVWHDGRLKYFQINNRFMLYTEKDNVLLASEFKINSKELKAILNPEGFDIEEHRIFSQFLVIISNIIEEYDRDIQVAASHVRTDPMNLSVQKQRPLISDSAPSMNHISTAREIHSNTKVTTSKHRQKEDSNTEGGFNISKLTLKVNKPFKKPKRILSTDVVNELNRPSIRNQRIQETTPQLHAANTGKIAHTVPKVVQDNSIAQYEHITITEEFKVKDDPDQEREMAEVSKSGIKRVGRIRKIVHKPLSI
ncbi:Mte1p SPAR_G02690 [Saccharomyces paradoxus]|uniref:Mte1p n=1 Tax=Saccharomyces paradoxus TaxID=27291 RepID=A0A8B8URT6_SACPA|nr:uncharacterized protein SPAR_G02690 [Saccharomyces paradoxus]QHS73359.1 hypothetical protein SPAR_G02690 [Saccharomyces paradoxus]